MRFSFVVDLYRKGERKKRRRGRVFTRVRKRGGGRGRKRKERNLVGRPDSLVANV